MGLLLKWSPVGPSVCPSAEWLGAAFQSSAFGALVSFTTDTKSHLYNLSLWGERTLLQLPEFILDIWGTLRKGTL